MKRVLLKLAEVVLILSLCGIAYEIVRDIVRVFS